MPRRIISIATKTKALADLASGRKTPKQIQAELKVTSGMLSRWKQTMRPELPVLEHKPAPETSPEIATAPAVGAAVRKRADHEKKVRAVAEYRKGRAAKEVGAEFGVTDVTIYAWARQVEKKEQKRGAADVFAQLTPSAAGMEAGLTILLNALKKMHRITCPNCSHTFAAEPPGYTESLVTVAAHLLRGEEP